VVFRIGIRAMEVPKVIPERSKHERFFRGERFGNGDCLITVDGKPLDPRFDLRNHSPAGFNWGYGGSGPAQAALAILADALGDDEATVLFYQDFKWMVISHIDTDEFAMSQADVIEWFERDPERAAFLARN